MDDLEEDLLDLKEIASSFKNYPNDPGKIFRRMCYFKLWNNRNKISNSSETDIGTLCEIGVSILCATCIHTQSTKFNSFDLFYFGHILYNSKLRLVSSFDSRFVKKTVCFLHSLHSVLGGYMGGSRHKANITTKEIFSLQRILVVNLLSIAMP